MVFDDFSMVFEAFSAGFKGLEGSPSAPQAAGVCGRPGREERAAHGGCGDDQELCGASFSDPFGPPKGL